MRVLTGLLIAAMWPTLSAASVVKLSVEYIERKCLQNSFCRQSQRVRMKETFTGVVVGNVDGSSIILTCGHYRTPSTRYVLFDDRRYQAHELHRHWEKNGTDWAAWSVPVKLTPTPLGNSPAAGQVAWFYGFPRDRPAALERSVRVRSGSWFDVTSGQVDHGDSGAPVGMKGTVQGIVSGFGRHQGEGYYTPIGLIRPTLAKWLKPQTKPTPPISTDVEDRVAALERRSATLLNQQESIVAALTRLNERLDKVKDGRPGPPDRDGKDGRNYPITIQTIAVSPDGTETVVDEESYQPGEVIKLRFRTVSIEE